MSARFLLAQRAPVEVYPPVVNQAALLSAVGRVTIVDSAPQGGGFEFVTGGDVRRVRVHQNDGGSHKRLKRMRSALMYRKEFFRALATAPDAVIAFEPEAAALLLSSSGAKSSALRIVHFHEHLTTDAYAASLLGGWSLQRCLSRLHLADIVSVADAHRGMELERTAALASPPVVVMNCPPRIEAVPESRLTVAARELGVRGPIVLYHGAVGQDHGLETAIASIQWWAQNASLIIVGSGSTPYVESLQRIAGASGVADRVFFLGRVPYTEIMSFVAGATIGLSLLDTSKPNWHFAAGASNKRFEYVALGIPQVTSPGPGIPELFESTRVALLADPTDARSVAAAVNQYLESPELWSATAARARSLHLDRLNYEAQFAPVLDSIRERAGRNQARA